MSGFTKVPDWWREEPEFQRISKTSCLPVLLCLVNHRDWVKDIGRIGNARIGAETNLPRRTIQRAIRTLWSSGFIKCWYGSDGKRSTRYYHVAMRPDQWKQHHICLIRAINKGATNKGAMEKRQHSTVNKGAIHGAGGASPMAPLSDLQEFRYKEEGFQPNERQTTIPQSFKEVLGSLPLLDTT